MNRGVSQIAKQMPPVPLWRNWKSQRRRRCWWRKKIASPGHTARAVVLRLHFVVVAVVVIKNIRRLLLLLVINEMGHTLPHVLYGTEAFSLLLSGAHKEACKTEFLCYYSSLFFTLIK